MLALADALEAGRILSYTERTLHKYAPAESLPSVVAALDQLSRARATPIHIAATLRLLATERENAQAIADRVELVWSGLEVVAGESRDTAVVVQELFRQARTSVLIASYAIDTHERAEVLFGSLAARMDAEPELSVVCCLNIKRDHGDKTQSSALVQAFSATFRDKIWPGKRLPRVYYDPRALSTEPGPKACLHAKCIVIDVERSFVTSANFTEAAHARNIEAGAVILDPAISRGLRSQFDSLIERGELVRLPGT
ncbi:MAG: phospholipase [Myxococcales bacterium]|nr:phospholipase [Myxococcales bacterium]MCB9531012.1 phospholipase [Myxococcales bacterium]